jgi:phosphatidylserine/phosphatidylglycerophosphate/cardiolipin synthase-like enzyme
MAKATKMIAPPLIDAVRPMDADAPLVSLVCSTYVLSLDQPNFFEQDFVPTVLGLGGVRDRGYAVPMAMERKLKEVYSALVADAHALADGGRPSLQIDILPVGHRTNHAKIVLIHRKRLVRLVIASANLTHEGYRRQREVGVVLDFKQGGQLPAEVLRRLLEGWSEVLATLQTEPLRKAFDAAISQVEGWTLPKSLSTGQKVDVVFGGGPRPLWQALVEAWPVGEPLLDWCICSPFWPDSTEKRRSRRLPVASPRAALAWKAHGYGS